MCPQKTIHIFLTPQYKHLYVHNINSRVQIFFVHTLFIHVHETDAQKIIIWNFLVRY